MYCIAFSCSTTVLPLNTFHLLVFLEEVECAVSTVGTQCAVCTVGTQCAVCTVGTQCAVCTVGTQCTVCTVGTQCAVCTVGTQYFKFFKMKFRLTL